MSLLSGLLGTSLPDVGSENFATRSKYKMSTSVMRLQLHSTSHVDCSFNFLSFHAFFRQVSIEAVEYTLADLNDISASEFTESLNLKSTSIVKLTSRCWVESTLV